MTTELIEKSKSQQEAERRAIASTKDYSALARWADLWNDGEPDKELLDVLADADIETHEDGELRDEDDLRDALREYASESYGFDKRVQVKVVFYGGGPGGGLLLTYDDGELIHASWWHAEWFEYADAPILDEDVLDGLRECFPFESFGFN